MKKRVPLDPDRFRNWRNYSDYAGGIIADQGAHVFDGIHLLMNASYPMAVTASRKPPHREGFDTAGDGSRHSGVSGRFYRDVLRELRGHEVQEPQRSTEPARWRQGSDGYRPRRLQRLSAGRGRHSVDHKKIRTRLRLRHRSARSKFPGMRADPGHTDRPDAARISGGARRATGESLASAWQAGAVE